MKDYCPQTEEIRAIGGSQDGSLAYTCPSRDLGSSLPAVSAPADVPVPASEADVTVRGDTLVLQENIKAQQGLQKAITDVLEERLPDSPSRTLNLENPTSAPRIGMNDSTLGRLALQWPIPSQASVEDMGVAEGLTAAGPSSTEQLIGMVESYPGAWSVPDDLDGPPDPLANDFDLDDLPSFGGQAMTQDISAADHRVHPGEDMLEMLSGYYGNLFETQLILNEEEVVENRRSHAAWPQLIYGRVREMLTQGRSSPVARTLVACALGFLALGGMLLFAPDIRLGGFLLSVCGVGLSGIVILYFLSSRR